MALKGQGHRSKTNGTIRFLDLENMLMHIDAKKIEAKIIILSALLRKLWPKTSFCIMVANVKRLRMSHVQTAYDVF